MQTRHPSKGERISRIFGCVPGPTTGLDCASS
jgi:hypothetical protein